MQMNAGNTAGLNVLTILNGQSEDRCRSEPEQCFCFSFEQLPIIKVNRHPFHMIKHDHQTALFCNYIIFHHGYSQQYEIQAKYHHLLNAFLCLCKVHI